jgi:hypothetical protein
MDIGGPLKNGARRSLPLWGRAIGEYTFQSALTLTLSQRERGVFQRADMRPLGLSGRPVFRPPVWHATAIVVITLRAMICMHSWADSAFEKREFRRAGVGITHRSAHAAPKYELS